MDSSSGFSCSSFCPVSSRSLFCLVSSVRRARRTICACIYAYRTKKGDAERTDKKNGGDGGGDYEVSGDEEREIRGERLCDVENTKKEKERWRRGREGGSDNPL